MARTIKRYKRAFKKRRKQAPGFLQKGVGIAKKAYKIAKFVAGAINVEYKYFINGSSLTANTWNGNIVSLLYPSQGVAANERVGDSIKMKDLVIRGEWNRNVAGLTSEVCRVIVFIDKEGLITLGSQLLETTGTYGSVYSQKNENNRYLTKTLYDRSFVVNNTDNQQRFFKIILKGLNHHVHFLTGLNTVRNNEIKIATFCQSASNGSQFTYISRFTYVDN